MWAVFLLCICAVSQFGQPHYVQNERMQLKTALDHANTIIKTLQQQLSLTSNIGPEGSELTKLRFDNEALERKVRKFAVHCQNLEDEKENIIQALGLKRPEDDISEAIFNLCDKLASLESECAATSKTESQVSATLLEINQVREKNSTLRSQISDYHKKIDKLVRKEGEHNDLVASLRRELEELRLLADSARGNAESMETVKGTQLRYLQQENSMLMAEVKAAKKQVTQMKAEIKILRSQCTEPVSELLPTKWQHDQGSNAMSKCRSRNTPGGNHITSPEKNEENSANISDQTKNKTPQNKASAARRSKHRIGMGEVFAATEENTQECKQS